MATKTFATFKLGKQLYGVDVMYVREINKQIDITPVPHAPEYIRGLVNLRGQIVTVMDIIKRLTPDFTTVTDSTCNLIIKTDNELAPIRQREDRPDLKSVQDSVGLLVDEIDEIVTFDDKEISPPPTNVGKVEGKFMSGVVQLPEGLLVILSIEKVLQHNQN